MRKNVHAKIAVVSLATLFVTLGLASQGQAFFSRDQWYHPIQNDGGAVTQVLLDNGNNGTYGTNDTNGANGSYDSGGSNGGVTPDRQTPTSAVPEPSTMLLLATGLMGVGLWRWRQRNN